jgi:tetratricopeptide (TPR) repeat protein
MLERMHPALRLLTEDLNDLRTDTKLRKARAGLYYAFDVFDLIHFAFPLDPTRDPGTVVGDQIYNDQVALFEVFHLSTSLVLLPEYRRELNSYLDAVKNRVENTDRLIATALKGTSHVSSSKVREEVAKDLEANAHVHLAVLMGFDQIGTDRMQGVVSRSISLPEVAVNLGLPGIAEIQPGQLGEDIFNEWWPQLQNSQTDVPPYELDRRRKSARSDSDAVARVIQLNVFAEQAYLEGKLGDRRAVFLYLSSAHRTQRLFALPSVRRALPQVDGSPLNIWRTRGQVFANIVFREYLGGKGGAAEEDFDKTLELLDGLTGLRDRAVRGASGCTECVLYGGAGEGCDLKTTCDRIKGREDAFQNLSLVARLRRYSNLLQKKPKTPDHDSYMAFFREVMEQENLPDIVLARRHALRSIRLSSESASEQGSPERSYLPGAPDVHDPEYREICEGVLEYGRVAATDPRKALKSLHDLEGRFLKLDASKGSSGEHEVVRAMLYLTLSDEGAAADSVMAQDGDRKAVAYCRQMMARYPEKVAEFRYIMVWAMNRLGLYKEARAEATKAIEANPHDPRFYHGRALVTSCWLEKQQPEIRKHLGGQLRSYFQDAEKAVTLYLTDLDRFRRAIAINLNNIAWEHSQEEYDSFENAQGVYDPEKGIATLARLEELMPKEKWRGELPQVLHTAAHVFYTAWRKTRRVEYLHKAKRFTVEAIGVRPEAEQVRQTTKQIDDALASMSVPN